MGGEWTRICSWLCSYQWRLGELTDTVKDQCPPPTFFGELIPDTASASGVSVLRPLTQLLMGKYPHNEG